MNKPIGTAMLIDDEEIDQRIYKRVLANSGLVDETLAFSLATEALDFLRANPGKKIDVIFLDINMPNMDGFEFLEAASDELGPSFAKMVVAMLTTSLNPGDEKRARGFDVVKEFISKPLEITDVQYVANMLSGDVSVHV